MKDEKKQKQLEKIIKEGERDERESLIWFQSGRTVRSVDFQRIENNPNDGMPLTHYELEVKSKLASAPSPFDELARVEEEDELERKEHVLKTRLGHLVSKARFSPQQRECYELYFNRGLSPWKVQKKLGISQSHFSHLKQQIERELMRVNKMSLKPTKISKRLTAREKEMMRLRMKGITLKEIAGQYGISHQAVSKILGDLKKYFV